MMSFKSYNPLILCKKNQFCGGKLHLYPFGIGGHIKKLCKHSRVLALFVQKTQTGVHGFKQQNMVEKYREICVNNNIASYFICHKAYSLTTNFYQSITWSQEFVCVPSTTKAIQLRYIYFFWFFEKLVLNDKKKAFTTQFFPPHKSIFKTTFMMLVNLETFWD